MYSHHGLLDRRYRALGYRFRVRSAVPAVARLVPLLLADLPSDAPDNESTYDLDWADGPRPFRISLDGAPLRSVGTALALVDELLWHVNREAIVRGNGHVLIHASAAVWFGRGLVFPAPAGSGKTTLVAALLRAGAGYVTDEAAVIDLSSGSIHPYPKPMWMSPRSARAIDGLPRQLLPEYRDLSRVRVYARPKDLSSYAVTEPIRVTRVIAPAYRPGNPTTLEPITRAEGVYVLARNAFYLQRSGASGISALARMVGQAECYRLRISDVNYAVAAIRRLILEGDPTPP